MKKTQYVLRRPAVAVAVLVLLLAGVAHAGSDGTGGDGCFGPRDVTASAGPDGIQVGWGAMEGAISYTITRTDGGTNITNLGPSVTSFLDSDVESGVTYTYEVGAFVDVAPGQPGGTTPTDVCDSATATAIPVFPTMMAGGLAFMWAVGAFLLMRS